MANHKKTKPATNPDARDRKHLNIICTIAFSDQIIEGTNETKEETRIEVPAPNIPY